MADEKCVECGAVIPDVRLPKELELISGSLVCDACAERLGLPTAANLFGVGRQ